MYSLQLDVNQHKKIMALQRGTVQDIAADFAMGNSSMTAKAFSTIKDILLRIIAIVRELEEDSDTGDARTLLETLHEVTV